MTWLARGVCLAVLYTTVNCECPNGFTRHNESCYALVRNQATWAESEVFCQSMGANLARVETSDEQHFMGAWLEQQKSSIPGHEVWIGGEDSPVEGDWHWGFQEGVITEKWWAFGEPNGGARENCLSLAIGFKWNDEGCGHSLYSVCELEAATNPIVG